jgi:hypothetical protein
MKSKDQKREEAAERQEKYDALSNWEKEIVILSRPGNSRRELRRILSR